MPQFSTVWKNHVGSQSFPCDQLIFRNQCAIRMGQALEDSGISLTSQNLKRCKHYSSKFKSHSPGHIRSAQQLANVLYRRPLLLGAGTKMHIKDGSIRKNMNIFKRKKGVVFIMNGWGSTDHIDVWDGTSMKMKGSSNTVAYSQRGKQVWFWEMK